jgi:hypothetical protein
MRIKVPQLPRVRFPGRRARRRSADGGTPGTLLAGILRVPRRIALALLAVLVAAASLVSFAESYRAALGRGGGGSRVSGHHHECPTAPRTF